MGRRAPSSSDGARRSRYETTTTLAVRPSPSMIRARNKVRAGSGAFGLGATRSQPLAMFGHAHRRPPQPRAQAEPDRFHGGDRYGPIAGHVARAGRTPGARSIPSTRISRPLNCPRSTRCARIIRAYWRRPRKRRLAAAPGFARASAHVLTSITGSAAAARMMAWERKSAWSPTSPPPAIGLALPTTHAPSS